MLIRRILVASAVFLALAPAATRAANPVTIAEPVTPPLSVPGTGLCIASAVSPVPQNDFGFLNAATYNGGMNAFIEGHAADRVESVVRTVLDLSNNNDTGLQLSFGDFTDAMSPVCQTGGCGFFVNNAFTAFGSRLRGFLNVTPDLAGIPIHFGLYADDAVSLVFYDMDANVYPILTRPPQLGLPTWRLTNTVTFEQPGLYPLEILYAEIAEHAALEMSFLTATFTDFELPANSPGSTNLRSASFTLFPQTAFFQTLSGSPSYQDLDRCKQCDRQFVNQPGNNGCDAGYYCNEAALCAPCDTAVFCGPTCSPCGGDTPYCVNINGTQDCGGCRTDADCESGFTCDLIKHECNECNESADCPRGEICEDHDCKPCDTSNACAGNSCNCCPKGANGEYMTCRPLDASCIKCGMSSDCPDSLACDAETGYCVDALGKPRCFSACVECNLNSDCPNPRICDVFTGHCVDEIKDNATPTCCGDGCVPCPADYPFCLPGPIGTACAQCRSDTDCPVGKPADPSIGEFCLSGQCVACTKDRRCGPRCTTCGGDTPYCQGQTSASATCVRCSRDDQCAAGTCNPTTHECDPGCAATCAPATPYCDGAKCVECYADTQCPCGETCNTGNNTCSTSCKNNGDCLGNEHCRWDDNGETKDCDLGPMPGDVACGGTLASYCEGSIGRKEGDAPSAGVVALAMLALLRRRRARGKS
jgi:outer membrane exchange protein TraA